MQKVPIQSVLANVSEELSALSSRLQDVEVLLLDPDVLYNPGEERRRMQDIDLIIQQIADLGRAVGCVANVELEDLSVKTSALGDQLHLNDLRQRLLGLAEEAVLEAPEPSNDVMFF